MKPFKSYSVAKPRKFTRQAFECYMRGGICEGCEIQKQYEIKKCRMKETVIELFKLGQKPRRMRGKRDIKND